MQQPIKHAALIINTGGKSQFPHSSLRWHHHEFGSSVALSFAGCILTYVSSASMRTLICAVRSPGMAEEVDSAPDILIIHLGGNSLCRGGRDRLSFLREIKRDLATCFIMFPSTRLVFSHILPRLNWRGQRARTGYGVEKGRRWINSKVAGFLAGRQMRCIRHRNICLSHLCRDGVHLSREGNQLLLGNLREALREELQS